MIYSCNGQCWPAGGSMLSQLVSFNVQVYTRGFCSSMAEERCLRVDTTFTISVLEHWWNSQQGSISGNKWNTTDNNLEQQIISVGCIYTRFDSFRQVIQCNWWHSCLPKETSDQNQKLCALTILSQTKVCCVSGPHYSEFDPWLLKKIKSTRKNIIKKEKEKDGEKDKDKRETEET